MNSWSRGKSNEDNEDDNDDGDDDDGGVDNEASGADDGAMLEIEAKSSGVVLNPAPIFRLPSRRTRSVRGTRC